MSRKLVIAMTALIMAFIFIVPVVPHSTRPSTNCVFCPVDLGIDYASVTYVLLGVGVYHTVWGTIVLKL